MYTIQKIDKMVTSKVVWQEFWLPPINLWNAPLLRGTHGTPINTQHK